MPSHHSEVNSNGFPASDAGAAQVLPASLPLLRRGKVRDVYRLPGLASSLGQRRGGTAGTGPGNDSLLLVASDRISAFDVIMPTPIPGKGRILTAMSAFCFRMIARLGICETHLLSTDVADVPPELVPADHPSRGWLAGRVTLGRACDVVPIECVVRGYLEGSGLKEYQQTGTVCGVALPPGLKQCDKLPEPIFTPAIKAATGHDENVDFDRACQLVGAEIMYTLRDMSLAIYKTAAAHADARGIIIADTKFEFGLPEGELAKSGRVFTQPMLIDEVLTPDSSRFWPKAGYEPGRPQKSFDKQFLREYLETLTTSGQWDKTPPGPELPPEIVQGTLAKYSEALRLLTT
jgi:phosphoribosylaminoimidazole-succinocarboxamide synthase